MMAFSSFKQMLQEAMQDSGHLISTVAAIGGCLATGRSSLALAGILGAGKTSEHDIHLYMACLDHATSGSTHRNQQREPCRTGHSSTGGAYACARVKEAVVLQSL